MGCLHSSCASAANDSNAQPAGGKFNGTTEVKHVSIPVPSQLSPVNTTASGNRSTALNVTSSVNGNRHISDPLKSAMRSESSRRRTFTLSKDRLAAIDAVSQVHSVKQSMRKRSIVSMNRVSQLDSSRLVHANGLISTRLALPTNDLSPQHDATNISHRSTQRSHRKNKSSGDINIPISRGSPNPPTLTRIPTIDGKSITGVSSDQLGNAGITTVKSKRRSGRNTLTHDGLKSIKRRNSNNGMMSKMALRFPVIRQSFTTVHHAFGRYILERSSKYAQIGKGKLLRPVDMKITINNLGDVLRHIVHKKFTEDEIAQLFKLSDLDHSKCIQFREFLIAIALGYYLKQPFDELSETERVIATGFRYVREAFIAMDDDHSNSVDIKELKNALFSASSTVQTSAVLEARFKELDFNNDGDIELPEFLYGVVSWVGLMDDEDE